METETKGRDDCSMCSVYLWNMWINPGSNLASKSRADVQTVEQLLLFGSSGAEATAYWPTTSAFHVYLTSPGASAGL